MTEEKYRVLILDDDYELGELLREYLQNTRVCAVIYVLTEADFWDCLRTSTYDIIFLDYKLPDTNGLEILTRMGQAGYAIPTVMMTGEGNEAIAARAIQSGALDYLVKGEYSFSALPPLIQKAVRLREMQRAMQQYLDQIRYQAMLLDNMRDAVVVWGLDGTITYWNAAAEQLYGAPAAERLGRRVSDVYFPCFDPPVSMVNLMQGGTLQREHRFLLPAGERIWISSHITPMYDEGNRSAPTGYMDVARDITPRKLEQEALQKSQHFILRILDTSPNIIYILDVRTRRIRYINPEVKAILGYPVETFTNASYDVFTARVHPADQEVLAQHLHDLSKLKNGEVYEIEFRFISRHNEWRWLKSRETIFSRGESGAAAEIIGVMQDITTSKLAEEKLQRRLTSEKLLSTISNNFINLAHPDTQQGISTAMQLVGSFIQVDYGVIFLMEGDVMIPFYSSTISTMDEGKPGAAYTPFIRPLNSRAAPTWLIERLNRQEILVLNQHEAPVTASLKSSVLENAEDSTAQGTGVTETALPDLLPEESFLEGMGVGSLVVIPMIYNNGLYGILGFGTRQRGLRWTEDDIYVLKTFSEMITSALIQKQIDQALRVSEARYRAIVEEHQTEMICRFLPDTSLTFVNEAYCRYYVRERSELVSTSFLNPVLPDDQEQVRANLSFLSKSAPVRTFQQRVRLPGGQIRWQEWVCRAIIDEHTDFIEYQAVGRDITERKEMEEQIKTAQTHLAQAARLSSIGELASSVAHQISNPLTTIIADAQILRHQMDRSHPDRESVEAIVAAGWRAQQVINELMKFSQPTQATFEPVSINETIEAALLLASAHIQASGVQLDVDLQPKLPPISANPRQLTDLWVNLLLLARSAFENNAEHKIHITTRLQEQGSIVIEVMDNGIPIPADQYETIFEPQLIPSGSGRGTGMELSLCREIVRQNHGQISISGNGQHTTFHILFAAEGNSAWTQSIS